MNITLYEAMYGIILNNTFDTKISNFILLMVNILFYNVNIRQSYLIFFGFHNLLDITMQQKNTYKRNLVHFPKWDRITECIDIS